MRRVVLALIAALVVGIGISLSGSPGLLGATHWLEPVGALWVNGIRMTVVPLVVSLLFVGVATPGESGGLGRLGARTLGVFAGLVGSAAMFAMIVVPPLVAALPFGASTTAALRATAVAAAAGTEGAVQRLPTFAQWLTSLVPVNPLAAAADGAMLPLIVFVLLFALAAARIEPRWRDALLGMFSPLADAMLVLVGWLVAVAPLGVFALIVPPAARLGVGLAGAIGWYVVAMSVALLGLTALLYPVAVVAARLAPGAFARAALPAQAVALGSSSSLASLPALIEGARDTLALPRRITGFVLPLAVATFKFATPVTWTMGTLFVARLYGVRLGATGVATVAVAAVVLSFSIPGVPQGALLLLAPMLASVGVPAEGVGLLLAADTIPDLVATMTNVTGDLAAAAILARWTRAPAGAAESAHDATAPDGPPLAAGGARAQSVAPLHETDH